jgi:hypothetical protein
VIHSNKKNKQLNNMSKKCKHCRQTIYGSSHYCPKTRNTYSEDSDDSDFLLSVVIGYATDSAFLGGLLGGDMSGGILGDMFDGDLMD